MSKERTGVVIKILGIMVVMAVLFACANPAGSGTNPSTNTSTKSVVSAVYAGGYCTNSTGEIFAGYWKNGTWTELTNPYSASKDAYVLSIVISGSDVYAGGYCFNASGLGIAGYWKNGTWVVLTNNYGSYGAEVVSLAVSGTDVYAGGICYNNFIQESGYWKNGIWVALPNPYSTTYGTHLDSLVVSGSDVYACGYCWNSSWVEMGGYWKNGGWVALTTPSGTSVNIEATAIAVSGSDVYVSGGYTAGTSYTNIVSAGYWKDGIWSGLSNGYGSSNATQACSIIESGSDLYVGGMCNNGMGVNYSGYWKDGAWQDLNLNGEGIASITSLVINGSDVYASGPCYISPRYTAGYWDGYWWHSLTNPYGSYVSQVNSLELSFE